MLNVVNEQCLLFFFLSKHMTVGLETWNTNQGCILRLLLRVLKNFLHGLLFHGTEVIYLEFGSRDTKNTKTFDIFHLIEFFVVTLKRLHMDHM